MGTSPKTLRNAQRGDVPLLTLRQLNRATLARQMMLERRPLTPLKAIERLVGLQAQVPRAAYIALWSRLSDFRREDFTRLAIQRKAIRATLFRATIHLVSRADYLAMRGLVQAMLSANARSAAWGRRQRIDPAEVLERARVFFGEGSSRIEPLRKQLRDEGVDPDRAWAMAYHVATDLPLVRVPDGSDWGYSGSADFALADVWLGTSIPEGGDLDAMVLRYLGAFGPATILDAQAWCGLRGLKPAFERLRPALRIFREEEGRELFDVPRGLRPDGAVRAPVRFLPDYDNLILGFADRSRFVSRAHWDHVKTPNYVGIRTFMIDGLIAGTWVSTRDKAVAELKLTPFARLDAATEVELVGEGERLLAFLESDAERREVRLQPPSLEPGS